jgi:glucose/arabinose dehydrogenase
MRGWPLSAAIVVAFAAACATTTTPTQTAPTSAVPNGLVLTDVVVPQGMSQRPFDVPRQALVPPGWTMAVWARLGGARLEAWAPDGALLVSVPFDGKVWRLTPNAGAPARMSVLIGGLHAPHGIAFAGSTLYVAESDRIDAYTYANGGATGGRTVTGGLPDDRSPELRGAYAHALKSVVVGADRTIYFSIGSTGNISAFDRDATPQRATIMRISPDGGPAQPFARGVRNGTGLAVAPDGSVWTAVNNRDDIADPRPGPNYGKVIVDYVNEHPPESVARLTPGRELGWPYCNPDGGPANLAFIRDVQTNADGDKLDCAALPPVEQSLGAHSAPLGTSFAALPEPYGPGALIGAHGSWDRTPPRAPEVAFFPWRNGTLGNQQTLVGGFQAADGSRWGRPVAAVLGPDGAIYVTDDYAGAVYRLAPPGR